MAAGENELKSELIRAGRYLLENELAWGNAGNMSLRLDPGRFLITASGAGLGELDEADLVACPLEGEGEYARRPSKELPMHRAIYQARPEIQAVLHASPFYSTLVACSDLDAPADLFVEAMYYLERTARVPYHHPGAAELGEAVRARARQANVLFLENHGVLVYDTSLGEALMGLHTLEQACHMLVAARCAGLPFKRLPAETVQDFLQNSGYRRRRDWPEL